jgi:YidC/Oxa1 family membrane protein insertase
MLVSQKKLQAIQPKIAELQEKYKWDQAKIGVELMNLYKTEWVNPLGSCLPLLIQMPILIVLYWVISGISDPSSSYYLYSWLAHFEISSISTKFLTLDLLSKGGIAAIVLAILVGAAQFAQTQLSFSKINKEAPKKKLVLEKKPGEEWYEQVMPEMPDMSKMMGYTMPLMMAATTYFFPLWVGVYWLIGTLFMLSQQIVVNKILKK